MEDTVLGDSIIVRIRKLEGMLSPSENKVLLFCRDNPDKIVGRSIHSVAELIGVSASSISRISIKLGYQGWKDMQLSVARDLVRLDHAEKDTNPVFSGVDADDSDMATVKKMLDSNIASLRETHAGLDPIVFLKASKIVNKASRLVFFGCGGSGCVAHDEALRFSHLKAAAEAYNDGFQMIIQASRMTKNQVAIGFCNSGRTRLTVSALETARRNGAYTIGVSSFLGTPLEKACDLLLTTAHVHSEYLSASLTPRLSVLFIMDALYCLAAKHGRMHAALNSINRNLEATLRLPRRK